jgi:hypothetical protein
MVWNRGKRLNTGKARSALRRRWRLTHCPHSSVVISSMDWILRSNPDPLKDDKSRLRGIRSNYIVLYSVLYSAPLDEMRTAEFTIEQNITISSP